MDEFREGPSQRGSPETSRKPAPQPEVPRVIIKPPKIEEPKTPEAPRKEEDIVRTVQEKAEQARQEVISINSKDEESIKAVERLATDEEIVNKPEELFEIALLTRKYVAQNPTIGALNTTIAGRLIDLLEENPDLRPRLEKVVREAEDQGLIEKGSSELFEAKLKDREKRVAAIGDLLAPGLSGQTTSQESQEKLLFDENDPRFKDLPKNVQRAIRRFNRYAIHDPEGLTGHVLEGVFNSIADAEAPKGKEVAFEKVQKELLSKLREEREKIKQRETIKRQVAGIKDFETRGEIQQLIEQLAEESRRPTDQRTIREEILDIVQEGILASEDPDAIRKFLEKIEERVTAGDLSTQEVNLLNRSRAAFERRLREIEGILRRGQIRGIDYERYGYTEEDIEFIEGTLFKADEALEYIAKYGFDHFKREVKRVFNKLYSKANRTPRSPFQESFSGYWDKPTLETFERALNSIELYIAEHPEELPQELRGERWEVKEINPLTKELEVKKVGLDQVIGILREKMMHEYSLAEYTHNVYFILLTRGKLENLANYANRAHAVDIDALFIEEEAIEEAYYFFLEEVRKALTNRFWEIDTTFFAPDPRTFREHFEDKVRQKLSNLYRMEGRELSSWERERAISLARGAALGLTGELLDIIAQATPPKGEAAYRGYFGDVVAPAINPMHHIIFRFHPGKISDLFYALVRRRGTFSGWEWQELQKTKEYLEQNLYSEGLGGKPLIEFMNLFGSGSVLTRKGWRLTAATKHLLPGLEFVRVGNKERYIWTNVDVEQAWENLKKAGLGIAYTWATDILGRVDEESLSGEEARKVRELKEKISVENVLREVKKRNPLKFLYDLDRAKKYEGSLRQKVAMEMEQFRNRDFGEIIEEIDKIEDYLLLVQRRAINENREIKEGDFDLLSRVGLSEEEIGQVKEYWQAINRVVTIETKDGVIQIAGKKFQAPDFFFGSEDFHFEDLRFYEGGASLIARLFGDMNALGQASSEYLHQLEATLRDASQADDPKPLVDLNSKTRAVVQGIHGEGRAAEISYYIALINTRYFQKNWRARLPFLIGTIIGTITGQESYSKFIGGRGAADWDEQKIAYYIGKEVEAGNIPTKTRAEKEGIKFSDGTLICDLTFKEEVGARKWQVAFDVARTAIPLIIFLIMLQAAKEETRQ